VADIDVVHNNIGWRRLRVLHRQITSCQTKLKRGAVRFSFQLLSKQVLSKVVEADMTTWMTKVEIHPRSAQQ